MVTLNLVHNYYLATAYKVMRIPNYTVFTFAP